MSVRFLRKVQAKGSRGLPGGTTLPQLLAEYRNARNPGNLPELTIDQILAWADSHHNRKGDWPRIESAAVFEDPDEKWVNINAALQNGHRGLPGGHSLAGLLAEHREARNTANLPDLTT